jgi:hypothetical protein
MRLLCAISHHGLGHLAQAAPVLAALHELRPDIEWLIWSGHSHDTLASRLSIPFTHRHEATDIGLTMLDAVRVDMTASLQALLAFHDDWADKVARETLWLQHEGIDAVLSNVGYLPLAAAAQAGKPGVAFCSLNWRDIVHAYWGDSPQTALALAHMETAYRSVRTFLKMSPGMPMDWLPRAEWMPPVAELGLSRRKELGQHLGLDPRCKWVVLGLGGVAYGPPPPAPSDLPLIEDVRWLVPDSWPRTGRGDMAPFSSSRLPFKDVLASSDALITKVGYGSFVEAAGLGLPVLYLERPDWPESPWLSAWLAKHGRTAAIRESTLFSPALGLILEALWVATPPPATAVNHGRDIALRILREFS